MSDTLNRLITLIETRLAAIEEALGVDDWQSPKARENWKARQAAYRGLIDDLVSMECAKYRVGVADAYHLKLGGISTSCTGGDHGLLTNWLRRARLQLAAEKAVAA